MNEADTRVLTILGAMCVDADSVTASDVTEALGLPIAARIDVVRSLFRLRNFGLVEQQRRGTCEPTYAAVVS